MTIEGLLTSLPNARQSGAGWTARCPAHEDRNASLSISAGTDGRILLHCHAGCAVDAVCGALGIKTADLFNGKPSSNGKPRIVATYPYVDERGKLLYEVVRFDPKSFRQRKPDTSLGGWSWSVKGVRRVPFRLPQVIEAVKAGTPVFIVEGEKDCLALEKAGFTATCNAGGAGKWQADFSQYLTGAEVIVISDKDDPGRKHAADVASKLAGTAASVKVLELPDVDGKPVKDAFDFFAAGGTAEQLRQLVATAQAPVRQAEVAVVVDPEDLCEFDYANRLAEELPPIKTVGSTWRLYEGGVWRLVERASLRPVAQSVLPPVIRTARREGSLLDHLEGRCQVKQDAFAGFYKFTPEGSVLLNAGNGLLRVDRSGNIELMEHSAEHLFTAKLAANYVPTAEAPLFSRVLSEALPDPMDQCLFQLCAGNFLFPDCRFETALVCYGEAGRGKSTLAEPVAHVMGSTLVPRLTMSQICDPRSYHVPKLQHAAVNLGTELDAVELGESASFKAIVSGEAIEARPIYGAPFTMTTTCKLWFLANCLPRFKHGTEAELRRTRFLRFDYLPAEKDVTLKTRLLAERDGVFQWMLAGLVELLNLRFIPLGGPNSKRVHDRFRVSNDPVGAFVQAHCHLDPEVRVSKRVLLEAYEEFREEHDLSQAIGEWFFRSIYDRWPQLKETRPREAADGKRERMVGGIQLKGQSYAN